MSSTATRNPCSLARPFTADEVASGRKLAEEHQTSLEGPVMPVQVLGSGPFINAAVDNGVARAAELLGMTVDEVKNRATISGAVEIGRLPGAEHGTDTRNGFLGPVRRYVERRAEIGLLHDRDPRLCRLLTEPSPQEIEDVREQQQ